MDKIYLVYESGGSYDSAYSDAILAYANKGEAELAVIACTKEMKQIWAKPDFYQRLRDDPQVPGEIYEDRFKRIEAEQDAWIKSICQVYPCEQGGHINVPSANNDVDFGLCEMPISKLP